MKRQPAWRVFAGEYNDSTVEIKEEGDMAPSYVVTPLGAKVNRLFIIGVLTDVENISEEGDLLRAHISDPTGVFTLYSGEYQQEATEALSNIEVPAFVAVVGKTRTYSPEEGTVFVSIRPEQVLEVNSQTRDKWILETCKSTKERIEGVLEAKTSSLKIGDLKKLGYSQDVSEGILTSLERYTEVDLDKYVLLLQESLQYITPGEDKLPDIQKKERTKTKKEEKGKTEAEKVEVEEESHSAESEDFEEIEKTVLETIRKLEGEEGAPWDSITEECEKSGVDKDSIEEALNSLMDKGLIYEPILGTIKTT